MTPPTTPPPRPHHRSHRPGRLLPRRAPAREGLRGPRPQAPRELFNTERVDHLYQDPHDDDVRFRIHYGDMTDSTNLIRHRPGDPAGRDLQPGRESHVAVCFDTPEYTANADGIGTLRLLEAIRILGMTRRASSTRRPRRSSTAPSGRRRSPRRRRSTRAALRRRQAVRLLDHGQLPRGVRHPRHQRHPVQPREPAPRRDVRDAQDHARRAAHLARAAGLSLPGQPGRAARLGPRPRLRRGHVAHPAARRARRLGARDRPHHDRPPLLRDGVPRRRHRARVGGERRPTRSAVGPTPAPSSCRSIRPTTARPRSSCSWATRRRPSASWAGRRRTSLEDMTAEMVAADQAR